jgi:hypothetical protein
MGKKATLQLCGECGASVESAPGHPRNWPRMIVAGAASLREAIVEFQSQVDEYNARFAVPEFAIACEEKWGRAQSADAVDPVPANSH